MLFDLPEYLFHKLYSESKVKFHKTLIPFINEADIKTNAILQLGVITMYKLFQDCSSFSNYNK